MSAISVSKFMNADIFLFSTPSIAPKFSHFSSLSPPLLSKFSPSTYPISQSPRKTLTLVFSKPFEAEEELSSAEDEWLKRLPDKNKPLYSHSLPCIEAWLRNLGFCQSKDDRAIWLVEKPDWHAQLSLDVTDLYIRLELRSDTPKIANFPLWIINFVTREIEVDFAWRN